MKYLLSILSVLIIVGCDNQITDHSEAVQTIQYQLTSYLDINIDSLGRLPKNPYVVEVQKNGKHIIVAGTLHSRDTLDPMFASIEEIFIRFNPSIVINEGGSVHQKYLTRNKAIQQDGEVGLLKFLCDNATINMRNGDASIREEFSALSNAFSREEALFFFASERFILPFKHWGSSKMDIDNAYTADFIEGYLKTSGITLSEKEKTFRYYKTLFKTYFNADFRLEEINEDDFATIRGQHHFSEVARKSCEFRDKHLLSLIESELKNHDKIMIVFGGWHVLAIEPAIRQIIEHRQL